MEENGEDMLLEALYCRTWEEIGETEIVDTKESGSCLPEFRIKRSTEDPNKANCGVLTLQSEVL